MNAIEIIGWALLATGWLIALGFIWFRFRGVWFGTNDGSLEEPAEAVAIIIAARNEATNLRKNLPHLLMQDYPDYTIYVVDDHSDDATAAVVRQLQQSFSHLHLLVQQAGKRGKKEALTTGIAATSQRWLLFTDADCCPASTRWLSSMVAHLATGAEVVIGYSPITAHRGWVATWTAYETMMTGLLYLSAAISQQPYMAVGRNLAYHRDVFNKVRGFSTHMHMRSGDDDLLIQSLPRNMQVAVESEANAWMWTEPPASWRQLWQQKQRHLSTGWQYQWRDLAVLGSWSLGYALRYGAILWWLVFHYWGWALVAIVITGITQFAIFERTKQRLAGSGRYFGWPLSDVLYAAYLMAAPVLASLNRKTQWK